MFDNTKNKLFACHQEEPKPYIQLLNGEFDENADGVDLADHNFSINVIIEEINFVSRYLRKQWMFIQNLVLLDNNLPFKEVVQSRQNMNKELRNILKSMCRFSKSEEKRKKTLEAINSIAVSVLSLETFEDKILLKLCYSAKQDLNCPVYEYFHSYLDIQFYILLLRLKCDSSRIEIEENVARIMTDIIILSRKYFVKEFNKKNTCFLCPCIKNFWLILQLVLEKKINCDIFWEKFNVVLKNDEALFSFWILKDVANQQNINIGEGEQRILKPNYSFIKEKLKNVLGTSSDISNHLKMIYPIISQLWLNDTRVEILLLLWDHFSKRLNISTKYKTGHYISCIEFTELLDTVIFNAIDCNEEFEFFIGLMLNYLRQQPKHWGKIKCRIFSQLSPFKIGELDEVGIYRVFELFISLLHVNQEELSKKILSVYGNLKEKMITATNVNIYLSFIIRHVRENKDVEKIAVPLVKTLQNASENQNFFHIIKEFLDNFQHVVNLSSNMQLHQWTLLDTWIIKYMATCYLSDLESAVKVLLSVVRKINMEDAWSHWESVFKLNVYAVLKQIGNTSSCPPIVGELAGEMSCLSTDLLNDAFIFFNSEAIDFRVTEKYLCTVLKKYPSNVVLSQIQEKIAMQSWIRICLYSTQNYKEITFNIMKLESIPTCIKNGINQISDPLVSFIEILGYNKSLFITSPVLSRFSEMCFENLDQSLAIHLPQIKNEMVILRVYTCLAIALLQCGPLLYDRYKTSSPVTKLMSCLLFPTEFIMGKIPHPFLDAIRKTWHIYFEGLLKLGVDNDIYIQRALRDLISKYIPYYSVAESPIYMCLTRENSAKVILEKLCSLYFKHPTKENDLNVTKALKILNEYVKSSTSVNLLKIVVTQTLFGLCEVYIFHNQRNLALTIIVYIATCSFYEHLKEEVMKSLLLLTEKHLAFNSKTYFNLINILAKTIPSEILILKESILEKIKNIERIRGIGYDDNLRSHLGALNAVLNC